MDHFLLTSLETLLHYSLNLLLVNFLLHHLTVTCNIRIAIGQGTIARSKRRQVSSIKTNGTQKGRYDKVEKRCVSRGTIP